VSGATGHAGAASGGGRGGEQRLCAGQQVDLGDEQSAGGVRLAVVSRRVVVELKDADAVGPVPRPGVAEARHLALVHIV